MDSVKAELKSLAIDYSEPFREPSVDSLLDDLQGFIGKKLPDEFVELYEYCNGTTRECFCAFPYGLEFLSLEMCVSRVKENDELSNEDLTFELNGKGYILEHIDKEIESNVEFSKYRLPIATATRMTICVDLSPSIYGKYGQVIFIDHEYRYGIFLEESLPKLFEKFKNDISAGLYSIHDQFPGQLIFDSSIDLANWYMSPRWSHVPKPESWH